MRGERTEERLASAKALRHYRWWYPVLRRFIRNGGAVLSLLYILLLSVVAFFAYWLIPDKTPNANTIILELANLPPGMRIFFLKVRKNQPIPEKTSWWQLLIHGQVSPYIYVPILEDYRFEGTEMLVSVYQHRSANGTFSFAERRYHVADIVYPLAVDKKPETLPGGRLRIYLLDGRVIETDLFQLYNRIEKDFLEYRTFWLGTDKYGRDILSRLCLGARVSLSVGFIAVLVSLLIGIPLGLIGGYFGGRIDDFVMWLINVVWSIPTLLLVFALILVLGRGPLQVFLAVGLTMWVEVARVVRGQVIQLRAFPYIEASRALGIPVWRILVRHILPNITGPILVVSASNFAAAIIIEAGLSYLGLGVQPPTPSWGAMIGEYYGYFLTATPHVILIPGLTMILTVLAFYQIGNGLRDAFDVRL